MTPSELLSKILELYYTQFAFDVGVFSNGWLYAPLGIPILFYLGFFFVKWIVLTLPIWLPFSIIIAVFRK